MIRSTACARERTSSFVWACSRCLPTVPGDAPRRAAISPWECPRTAQIRTSASRAVSCGAAGNEAIRPPKGVRPESDEVLLDDREDVLLAPGEVPIVPPQMNARDGPVAGGQPDHQRVAQSIEPHELTEEPEALELAWSDPVRQSNGTVFRQPSPPPNPRGSAAQTDARPTSCPGPCGRGRVLRVAPLRSRGARPVHERRRRRGGRDRGRAPGIRLAEPGFPLGPIRGRRRSGARGHHVHAIPVARVTVRRLPGRTNPTSSLTRPVRSP